MMLQTGCMVHACDWQTTKLHLLQGVALNVNVVEIELWRNEKLRRNWPNVFVM